MWSNGVTFWEGLESEFYNIHFAVCKVSCMPEKVGFNFK